VLGTCMYLEMSVRMGTKSRQYLSEGQAYLDVEGPCSVVVSIKGKFFKPASH
jgi:hypothetical protein